MKHEAKRLGLTDDKFSPCTQLHFEYQIFRCNNFDTMIFLLAFILQDLFDTMFFNCSHYQKEFSQCVSWKQVYIGNLRKAICCFCLWFQLNCSEEKYPPNNLTSFDYPFFLAGSSCLLFFMCFLGAIRKKIHCSYSATFNLMNQWLFLFINFFMQNWSYR